MVLRLKSFFIGLLTLAVLSLSGCAYMTKDSLPPRVHVLGLQLQEAQLLEQRYLLKIRIQNPNDFKLDIDGMDFTVEMNGERFAQGVSNQAVSVPGFGEAITDISVSSSIMTLMRQLSGTNINSDDMKYRISGRVKLKGLPLSVSFENEGSLASLTEKN